MSDSRRVIVVEDDSDFRESVVEYLVLSGLDVTGVESALEFYQSISSQSYDVVILDIGLPDQNGLVLAEYVRNNTDMRIIMLTAQSALESKISAYQAGADIYLVKPVDFSELSASIYSILGRLHSNQSIPQALQKAEPLLHEKQVPWRLVRSNWTLCSPTEEEIKLTSKEFDLIERLAQSAHAVVIRHDLLSSLAYENNEYGNRSLDALVHRLRLKKNGLKFTLPIKTVHGSGYCFSASIKVV
jgi:DNA-binding response OmpR family regulator